MRINQSLQVTVGLSVFARILWPKSREKRRIHSIPGVLFRNSKLVGEYIIVYDERSVGGTFEISAYYEKVMTLALLKEENCKAFSFSSRHFKAMRINLFAFVKFQRRCDTVFERNL